MKIGILTQPLRHNYGGTLQNYALQAFLRTKGHQPVTIDLDFDPLSEKIFLQMMYWYRTLTGSYKKNLIAVPKNIQHFEQNFRSFERKHIDILRSGRRNLHRSVVKKNNLDALIVGSDQTWRKKYNPGNIIYNMFLDFAKDIPVKKIAYAASFGHEIWDFTKDETAKIKDLISNFDYVSVREDAGKKLCEEYLNTRADVVLDPTLLLSKDHYNTLADTTDGQDSIVVYFLDPTQAKLNFVKQFCNRLHKQMHMIGYRDSHGKYQSIESWLSAIRNADYVITDSFHGTVFSIIFNKPFYSIGNPKRGLSRIKTICDNIGLQDRILNENNLPYNIAAVEIEWNKPVQELNELIKRSTSLLENSLN